MLSRSAGLMLLSVALRCLSSCSAQTQEDDCRDLPEYITPCYREDPMISECVQSVFYSIVQKLEHGIPELDIPPIEPLFKEEIEAFDVAGLRLKFKNISVHGVSKLQLFWNSVSFESELYSFHGDIDPVEVEANYELSGFFFFVPIRAAGTVNVIARHIDFKVGANYEIFSKNGVDFSRTAKITLKTYIADGSSWIDNLGPFEVAINRILNTRLNARFIMDHVTPIIDESVAKIMHKFSNRILNGIPYDKLIPKGTGPVPATSVTPVIDKEMLLTNE